MSEADTAAFYLRQMDRAAKDACAFVERFDRAEFLVDRKTQQAVVMSLMILGEASARMIERCPKFVADHATIPWIAMRGLRNRIAHGYFEIDMEVVWRTVHDALPDFIAKLQALDTPN